MQSEDAVRDPRLTAGHLTTAVGGASAVMRVAHDAVLCASCQTDNPTLCR